MRIKFILIIVLQVLLLCGIIAYREYWIATGDRIVLKTRRVDPRDLFRGDYVRLTYEITNIDIDSQSQKPEFLRNQPVYVSLVTSADGTSTLAGAGKEPPANARFIQGRVRNEYTDTKWNVTFRDDSNRIWNVKPQWFHGMKKGEKVTFCLDAQGAVSLFVKDETKSKLNCALSAQPVHGTIEEIVETRIKKLHVEYGIEDYFVEEGKGIEIERGRNIRGPLKVEVSLRKDGKGIISRLIFDTTSSTQ